VSFKIAGANNIYMEAYNGQDSGWSLKGAWTAVAAAQPDFSLGISPNSQTITTGGSTTYTVTVTVTPSNGFSATVSFAVSGLPSGATGTFNPTSVTGSGSTTLTVTTTTN